MIKDESFRNNMVDIVDIIGARDRIRMVTRSAWYLLSALLPVTHVQGTGDLGGAYFGYY
jgi:hypothetical protein